MGKQKRFTPFNNPSKPAALLVAVWYVLTFFIYEEFGIQFRIGLFILFAFLSVSLAASTGGSLSQNRTQVVYIFLAGSVLLYLLLPSARIEHDSFAMMISLLLTIYFVIGSRATEIEIVAAMRVIRIIASLFAIYVIIIAAAPSVYFSYISPFVSNSSKQFALKMLGDGYGIFIGGSPVFIDYVLAIAIFITVSRIAMLQGKQCAMDYIALFMYIIAMLLENRKAELLATVIVIVYIFFTKLNFTTKTKRRHNKYVIIIGAALMLSVFAILASKGYFGRYILFLERLAQKSSFNDDIDISSGRIMLWDKAFYLFWENPLFGIGWGQFANQVGSIRSEMVGTVNNVHNNYLQLLCETGIVGFTAILYFFKTLLKHSVRCAKLLRGRINSIQLRIAVSTAIGFQVFAFIVSLLDPIWYKPVFWWFFVIEIKIVSSSYSVAYVDDNNMEKTE